MNILKNSSFWASLVTAGAYCTFGPPLLTMIGVLDSDVARFITLYVAAPIFIPSFMALKIASWFENRSLETTCAAAFD